MRIAVFTKNQSNPAYAAARIGADRVAERFGAQTQHYVPATPDDVAEQIALVAEALAEGTDAIVIAAVHPQRLEPALAAAVVAGVPIISFVNRAGSAAAVPTVSHVGADDAALATRMAEHLFDHLARMGHMGRTGHTGHTGQGARIVTLEGPAENVTSQTRVAAFERAAARRAGVQVVGRCLGRYLREPAREAFAAWCALGGPFDAVWAANDVMALGVLDVLRRAGRPDGLGALGSLGALGGLGRPGGPVPVVGVNAIPEAVQAIAAGEMLASADFNAMAMCALATECALRHLRGEPVPAELMLPVEVVDRSNCARWDRPYRERALPTLAGLTTWHQDTMTP